MCAGPANLCGEIFGIDGLRSESPLVRAGDELFERNDLNLPHCRDERIQSVIQIEVPESPVLAAEHNVCGMVSTCAKRFDHRNHFERHLLLGGSMNLLPLE